MAKMVNSKAFAFAYTYDIGGADFARGVSASTGRDDFRFGIGAASGPAEVRSQPKNGIDPEEQ